MERDLNWARWNPLTAEERAEAMKMQQAQAALGSAQKTFTAEQLAEIAELDSDLMLPAEPLSAYSSIPYTSAVKERMAFEGFQAIGDIFFDTMKKADETGKELGIKSGSGLKVGYEHINPFIGKRENFEEIQALLNDENYRKEFDAWLAENPNIAFALDVRKNNAHRVIKQTADIHGSTEGEQWNFDPSLGLRRDDMHLVNNNVNLDTMFKTQFFDRNCSERISSVSPITKSEKSSLHLGSDERLDSNIENEVVGRERMGTRRLFQDEKTDRVEDSAAVKLFLPDNEPNDFGLCNRDDAYGIRGMSALLGVEKGINMFNRKLNRVRAFHGLSYEDKGQEKI